MTIEVKPLSRTSDICAPLPGSLWDLRRPLASSETSLLIETWAASVRLIMGSTTPHDLPPRFREPQERPAVRRFQKSSCVRTGPLAEWCFALMSAFAQEFEKMVVSHDAKVVSFAEQDASLTISPLFLRQGTPSNTCVCRYT